ncbi:cytochrome P450 monooxygenase [Rhodofomes roseus]|uniref:Cytochrome P450 monooxygenase n=1 Tax=Rhodofomes roseus TaxID=34475 RepID=A0ABQ8KB81_9APHY|nr:cytochrome P450 monooxygenase [Rhodofomes roseus]KAH9834664.1 cytochrome P450 monooxygenase [Rhodofomes roseus]
MPALPSVVAIICLGLAAAVLSYVLHTPRRGSLPPGPPRVPLLGNAHQLPQSDQHLTFTKWAAQYGDVVYVEIFTRPTIILNSAKAAIDLMDKRGAIYSDRPRFVWFHELIGWTSNTSLCGYNETWRRMRKWFQHAFIARSAVDSYHPVQRREARRLLLNLLHHPDDFVYQIKRYTAGIIFEIGYGHDITSLDGDKLLQLTERGIRAALVGSSIGSAMVDFFPVLRYLPAWLPGMSFKYAAIKARKGVEDMEMTLYNTVNEKIVAGIARPSFAAVMIEECSRKGDLTAKDEDDIKGTLGTLYQAGTDSSLTTLIVFVLVMVQYPDVFRKAQEEMIRVVGDSRLPDFDGRASLPYLECVLMEVYRWCPIGPLSIPHRLTEDDAYRGYYLPKGSMVISNIWAMCRDPEVYPESDVFKPERFLGLKSGEDPNLIDPKKIVFGFGRRCGKYFADDTMWLGIASIVTTMDITKARDARGQEITPTPVYISGTTMCPEPFVCDIHPRSDRTRQLIIDNVTEP